MSHTQQFLIFFIVGYALIPYLLVRVVRWFEKRSQDRESKKEMWDALSRQNSLVSYSGEDCAPYNPPPKRP